MANLEDLELFVMISELDGLTPAARAMSITPAAASQALKRLESRLGVRLFNRTTRSMKLTAEGLRYLETAQHALKILADGKRSLIHENTTIELTAPSDIGRSFLIKLLAEIKQEKPNLHIKLSLSDKQENLLKYQYNAALRFGNVLSPDLVALSIMQTHHYVVCAAPSYLARHSEPTTPSDLKNHECVINYSISRPEYFWRFYAEGKVEDIPVRGHFHSDDGDVARRWALTGNGIAYLPILSVAEDILAGHLIPLLQGWEGELAPLNLVVSHRSQITTSLRVLHGALVKLCNERLDYYYNKFPR